MNPDAEPGAKAVFLFAWNGYSFDHEQGLRLLKVGETYTVKRTHPSQSSTAVELVEAAGERLNSVLFADADRLPSLSQFIEILQPSVEYCIDKASAKAHGAALTWLAGQVAELERKLTMERTLSSHHLGPTGAPEA